MMHLFRVKQVLMQDDGREVTVRYFRTPGSAKQWANSHGGSYVWEEVVVQSTQVICQHPSGAVLVKEEAEGSPSKKRPEHWCSSRIEYPDEFEAFLNP